MVKMASEAEMRRGIILTARDWGCEGEVRKIFEIYDKLLKNCTNEQERYEIGVLGNVELHKLMELRKALVIDKKVVVEADPTYVEKEDNI
jgi:hypothetical protein